MSPARTKIHVLQLAQTGNRIDMELVANIRWRIRVIPFSGPRSALFRIAHDPKATRLQHSDETCTYRARVLRTRNQDVVKKFYDFDFRVLPDGQFRLNWE